MVDIMVGIGSMLVCLNKKMITTVLTPVSSWSGSGSDKDSRFPSWLRSEFLSWSGSKTDSLFLSWSGTRSGSRSRSGSGVEKWWSP
jgi:hypothetical protein